MFSPCLGGLSGNHDGHGKTIRDSHFTNLSEGISDGTICVDDIKTGRAGLTARRMDEIIGRVKIYYPGPRRVIISEIRTGSWRARPR